MQRFVFCVAVFSLVSLALGCGQRSETQDLIAANQQAIEELPAGDREAALEQWSCVACGEMLGSKGKPVKAEVEGDSLFFCSQNCADEAGRDPAKVRSRLEQ